MQALEKAITFALDSGGDMKDANKVYLEFIKANFIIPIEKGTEKEPEVLFLQEDKAIFLPIFTDKKYLENWADEVGEKIALLSLSGVDLLYGIGEDVWVCLDIGCPHYKEFNPQEIARMRSMVLKLFKKPA